MAKLVILESPAKAKSVGKYLGQGYEVIASMGHLRDLPKSTLGVDLENDFEPKYIPIRGKAKAIKAIRDKVAKADEVVLATDPDREGEAIAWHLANLLKLDLNAKNRVTFNEITQKAVKEGIKGARTVDNKLVDAYQARRVLDRIVGYKLSPLLWSKVRKGLSAGRVQSVVTKLVVDRENEIRDFVPEEYWTIEMLLAAERCPDENFTARFHGLVSDGKKLAVTNKEQADEIVKTTTSVEPLLKEIRRRQRLANPYAPFITSTLQQEASRKLSFSTKKTMKLAQDLYEGMNIASYGLTGLITYMRTDSRRLSPDSISEARAFIAEKYGDNFIPDAPRIYRNKSSAQDAHEAIRPTHAELTPEALKTQLSADHYKLYKLIWERFIACQMSSAIYDTVALDIASGPYLYRANGRTLLFAGYTVLYEETQDVKTDEEESDCLPNIQEGDKLTYKDIEQTQKFTMPPSRYTEAALIKAMEEKNIGRPSTYSPTISLILDRDYVEREGRLLKPTALGEIVTELMTEKFTDIINVDFTAGMEEQLDEVELGNKEWRAVIGEFYKSFKADLEKAEAELADVKIEVPDIVTDEKCDNCGANMIVKSGRYGKFLACPNYPECKFTKPIPVETPGICPKCGGKIIELRSKNNKKYFACENRKTCGFMTWDVPLAEPCPSCGKPLFRRFNREEKKIHCAMPDCGYEREYKPRGRAKQADVGNPAEDKEL